MCVEGWRTLMGEPCDQVVLWHVVVDVLMNLLV